MNHDKFSYLSLHADQTSQSEIISAIQKKIDTENSFSHWKKGDQIGKPIAAGAFSIVCPIFNYKGDCNSVVKIISMQHLPMIIDKLRLEREIKELERYNNEKNFVKIHWYESFTYSTSIAIPNTLYLIKMEKLIPLDEWLISEDFFSLSNNPKEHLLDKKVIDIAVQLLDALSIMAKQGDVHRDIKPANIFVDLNHSEQPIFKLGDFGLCTNPSNLSSLYSTEGYWPGTKSFSPDSKIENIPTPYFDQYSLGALLFYLLNNGKAIDKEEHINHPSALPQYGIPELQRIVLKAYDPISNNRYRNITTPAVKDAVDEYKNDIIHIEKTWAECMRDDLLLLKALLEEKNQQTLKSFNWKPVIPVAIVTIIIAFIAFSSWNKNNNKVTANNTSNTNNVISVPNITHTTADIENTKVTTVLATTVLNAETTDSITKKNTATIHQKKNESATIPKKVTKQTPVPTTKATIQKKNKKTTTNANKNLSIQITKYNFFDTPYTYEPSGEDYIVELSNGIKGQFKYSRKLSSKEKESFLHSGQLFNAAGKDFADSVSFFSNYQGFFSVEFIKPLPSGNYTYTLIQYINDKELTANIEFTIK